MNSMPSFVLRSRVTCFEGKDVADHSASNKRCCENDQDYAAFIEKDVTHKVFEVVPKSPTRRVDCL